MRLKRREQFRIRKIDKNRTGIYSKAFFVILFLCLNKNTNAYGYIKLKDL